jgi:hypothetical protein
MKSRPIKVKSMTCPLCGGRDLVKVKLGDGNTAIRCMAMDCAYELIDRGNHFPHKEKR